MSSLHEFSVHVTYAAAALSSSDENAIPVSCVFPVLLMFVPTVRGGQVHLPLRGVTGAKSAVADCFVSVVFYVKHSCFVFLVRVCETLYQCLFDSLNGSKTFLLVRIFPLLPSCL